MSEQKLVRYVWAAPLTNDYLMRSDVIERILRGDGMDGEDRARRKLDHTDDQALFRVTVEEIEPPKPQVSDDYARALRELFDRFSPTCTCETCTGARQVIANFARNRGITLQEGGN